MKLPASTKATRLHTAGAPLRLDEVPLPRRRPRAGQLQGAAVLSME